MFRSLRINIFIYYVLTVSVFLGILHYFLAIAEIQNVFLLAVIMLCFVILSAVLISKLSIDPLQEHVKNLQNLSKETLHELNLPISTIMTNTQMIKKTLQDEKALKRLNRINSACEMLQQRYNELDYMIKTQSMQELKEEIDLLELINERIEFLTPIYPHAKFNLELTSTKIVVDKIGLAKVIDNIIDNGVKYAPNNHNIDIKLNNFELSIKDYGCGMDEVELIKIFENYYQANENMKGFGIGLGMVKRFCDQHNIELNLKSKLKIGTTVLLKFKEN